MSRLTLNLIKTVILSVSITVFSQNAQAYYTPYFPYYPTYLYSQSRVKYVDYETTVQQHLNNASASEELGNTQGALEAYSDAIRKDPKCVAAYMNRARIKYLSRDFLGAIYDFNCVLRIEPNNIDAKIARADVYRLTRNDISALNDYNRIINNDPQCADAFVGRGLVNYNLKRLSYTLNDLEEAKKLYLAQNNDRRYQSVVTLVNQIKKDHNIR